METQNLSVSTTGIPPQLGSITQDYKEIKETLSVRAIEDSKDGKKKMAVKRSNRKRPKRNLEKFMELE